MTTTKRFTAPWGKLLWGFSIGSVGILLGSMLMLAVIPGPPFLFRVALITIFAVTLIACAATMVRGYRLEGDTLVIERLGWEKRVPLQGLTAVRQDRKALDNALRVGNGGLLGFTGWYWSKRLGWFHLAGNDILGRAVLLEIGEVKWVITPEPPAEFVAAAQKLLG